MNVQKKLKNEEEGIEDRWNHQKVCARDKMQNKMYNKKYRREGICGNDRNREGTGQRENNY